MDSREPQVGFVRAGPRHAPHSGRGIRQTVMANKESFQEVFDALKLNFTSIEPGHIAELKKLTRAGFEEFKTWGQKFGLA